MNGERIVTNNQKAFLDMIAWSEGTWNIGKNDGYDVIVTSTVEKPILFTNFSTHPRREMAVLDAHGAPHSVRQVPRVHQCPLLIFGGRERLSGS